MNGEHKNLLVGIWLVRMTLHKTCKGIFFHDHMMRCPLDMSMLLWPLNQTFLIESEKNELTSNESKKNSRKFHSHKSLKFLSWTRAPAESNLLLLLFIQQIEVDCAGKTSYVLATRKLIKLKLSLDFHLEIRS